MFPPLILADSFQPSYYCNKPYKPFQFRDQYEFNEYLRDVEGYKDCIHDFIEEQNEAIRNHSNAAEDAIRDWNNFVNFEL